MELKGNVFTSTHRLLQTKTAITSHSLHLIYRNILKVAFHFACLFSYGTQ